MKREAQKQQIYIHRLMAQAKSKISRNNKITPKGSINTKNANRRIAPNDRNIQKYGSKLIKSRNLEI